MNARVTGRQVIAAFGGPVVWFAHFSIMYAVNAVQCARGQDTTFVGLRPIALTAALATAAAVLLILAFWRFGEEAPQRERPEGSTPDMLAFLTLWLNALSLVAILLTVIPVFIVRSC
jgi:hypothetical protein